MSDEREAYTVGRVSFSDDVRRIIRGELPSIVPALLADMEKREVAAPDGAQIEKHKDGTYTATLPCGRVLKDIKAVTVRNGVMRIRVAQV